MALLGDGPIIQCAANFSEGRNADIMAAIVDSTRPISSIRVADWSGDPDHNRMVVTLVGDIEGVRQASLAMAQTALAKIDLGLHNGVHPRLGVVDVLPFIPLIRVTLEECAELAVSVGKELAARFDLPVFLYEAAANGRSLPSVRKQAFADLVPDFGPASPHPTGGAAVVGARQPLIAFNVNLDCNDLALARQIASEIREAFAGRVRSLGLPLPSRGIVQISMNIIRPAETSLVELIDFIAVRAPVYGSELIGAMPGYAAFDTLRSALKLSDLNPGQILLESWPS
jgi:glutamate formiminotransferase